MGLIGVPGSAAQEAATEVGILKELATAEVSIADPAAVDFVDYVARTAINLSISMDHRYFGTDHLLIALLRHPAAADSPLLRPLAAHLTSVQPSPIFALLSGMGLLADRDLPAARAALEAAVQGCVSGRRRIDAQFNLALTQRFQGDIDEARALFADTRAEYSALTATAYREGLDYLIAHCAFNEGASGSPNATQLYAEALATYVWLPGTDFHIARCCSWIGGSLEGIGAYERAVEFHTVAAASQLHNPWENTAPDLAQRCDQAKAVLHAKIAAHQHESGTFDSYDSGLMNYHKAWAAFNAGDQAAGIAAARDALAHFQNAGAAKNVADSQKVLALLLGADDTAMALLQAAAATYRNLGLHTALAAAERSMGDLCERMRRWESAHEHFTAACDAALEVGDRENAAGFLLLMARMHLNSGRGGAAALACTKARILYQNIGSLTGVALCDFLAAGALRASGGEYPVIRDTYRNAYSALLELGNLELATQAATGLMAATLPAAAYDDAEAQFEQALEDLTAARADPSLLSSLRQIMAGVCAHRAERLAGQKDYAIAAAINLRAAELAFEAGDRAGAATCLESAGHCHFSCGRFDLTEKCYREVLERFPDALQPGDLARIGANLESAANAANGIGGIAADQLSGDQSTLAAQYLAEARQKLRAEDTVGAVYAARQALDLYRAANDYREAVHAVTFLAGALRDQGRCDEAMRLVDDVDDGQLDETSAAWLELARATILHELRDTEEAERLLRRAADTLDPTGAATARWELALLYNSLGHHSRAAEELDAVADVRRRRAEFPELARTLVSLAETRLKLAAYDDALVIVDELDRIYETLGDPGQHLSDQLHQHAAMMGRRLDS